MEKSIMTMNDLGMFIRMTPRSQALAPQGPRKGEEEPWQTDRHTVKALVKENDASIGSVSIQTTDIVTNVTNL